MNIPILRLLFRTDNALAQLALLLMALIPLLEIVLRPLAGRGIENAPVVVQQVFAALRAACPADRPISVRLSCHDWFPGGNTADDAVAIARLFKAAGADIIDCSSGQVVAEQQPVYGRMWQTPFADRIRNEVGIPTVAVGAIFEADHVNMVIAGHSSSGTASCFNFTLPAALSTTTTSPFTA